MVVLEERRLKKRFGLLIDGYEEIVIKEMAERLKDVVYVRSEDKIREAFEDIANENVEAGDSITIDYSITFIVTDVLQIIGREKRREDDVLRKDHSEERRRSS